MIGGYPESKEFPIELIDIDSKNGSFRCKHNIKPFPKRYSQTAAVLLGGKVPAVCGGQADKNCYLLKNNSWVAGPNLSQTRRGPMAITLNDTAWMVAGGADSSAAGTTSDILSLDGSRRKGPNLPTKINHGCAVKINDTTAIIMGGYQTNTYYYSIDIEQWSQGPSVSVKRGSQACGLLEDLADPNIKYIVFTGYNNKITEILQVGTNKWVRGPDFLPKYNYASHMVATPDRKSLVLSGGDSSYKKQLYRFQCSNGIGSCKWEKLPITTLHDRYWHASVFVPESDYPCNAN